MAREADNVLKDRASNPDPRVRKRERDRIAKQRQRARDRKLQPAKKERLSALVKGKEKKEKAKMRREHIKMQKEEEAKWEKDILDEARRRQAVMDAKAPKNSKRKGFPKRIGKRVKNRLMKKNSKDVG